MTENKNLRRHGEVTTRVMSEEERMEYIKKHPIIPTEKPKAGMRSLPVKLLDVRTAAKATATVW
nr:hypothetical protein [Bacillus subtilis]